MTIQQLRIARPVTDLAESCAMYCSGLGLMPIGEFTDHEGFSGVMLGNETLSWHLEFTQCHHHPVKPASTAEDLLVLYLPSETDWQQRCLSLTRAGFTRITSFNPYWAENGATFQDKDGYRTVLQHGTWRL